MRLSTGVFPTLCLLVAASFGISACGGNEAGDDQPPMGPPCSDMIDNDGDGAVDFPDDPGCSNATDDTEDSPASPQCSDGRDNDGDGKADFPNDPGCSIAQQDDETDECPDGATCPQCGNGRDDDNNGTVDYPDDPGCESAADATEIITNPNACGMGLAIRQLPATGMAMGMLDGTSTSQIMSPCGGGAGAPAVAFLLLLTEPKVVIASTDSAGTTADTVIDIRGADCMAAASHLACNDDISSSNTNSAVTTSLPAGTYYIIVQGHDASSTGTFELNVDIFSGEGATCAMQEDCGPGLVCRTPAGGSQMICTKPVCSDGIDDDGDGKIDHPNDPGCSAPADDSETDDCPNGPNCPDCSDGVDNDGDTKIDFPMDTSCHAAGDTSEACVTSEAVETIVGPMTSGTTVGVTNDYDPTCNSSTGLAPDRLYRLDLPATSTLSINMTNLSTGYNSVTALLDSTCGGTAIKCSDPANMVNANLAAGTYYLAVDGFATDDVGTYTIAVSGTVAPGGSCEGLLYQSGALTCPTGFVCDGTAGARTCRTQCSDGIDNNMDGKTDYPLDPGCSSPADNEETTVCPGAMCPACANGVDDDGDSRTDYPQDSSCAAAGSTSESCTQSEAVGTITAGTTTGTTAGQTNDYNPTCATSSSAGSGPDVAFQVDLPKMATVSFNLSNPGGTLHDSVHVLLPASCQTPELVCRDATTMPLTNIAAGRYHLIVDGYSSTSAGPFTITTAGTVAPGGSCEGPLFASGAFTCVTGTTCDGPAGSRTCRSACSDGIDNNGNGKIDYPNDPGCTSAVDDMEDTLCPGAMCPACADMTDNDMDSRTDYPADIGCVAASGTSEVFCPAEPAADFGGQITAATTNGTLATGMDNYETSCQANTGNDKTYALVLPVPVVSMRIDTEGSQASDTVLTLKDAQCSAEIACDDDGSSGPQGFQSVLSLGSLAAGAYAINVNGYGSSNNLPFVLHVKGVVAPMTTCTSPLFAAGVLACPTGTTCTQNKCQ